MAVLANAVSAWFLIASVSYVFCLPKGDVMKRGAGVVDVTTPNPNNQTQTGPDGAASEDVQSATPTPYPQNQTAAAQPEVTDGPSEDDVTATPNPQNQTTPAQTENADGLSEDASATTSQQPPSTTTSQQPPSTISPTKVAEQSKIINKHNTLRSRVRPTASNMLKMRWNSEAATNAQRWADTCSFEHSDPSAREINGRPCGENLYMASNNNSWSNAIQTWYDEVKDFKFGTGSINGATVGHYTQVVAYRSDQLGCGRASCPGSKYFYVCHYCPSMTAFQDTRPYKSGTACGDCKKSCEDNLCTNPCPYFDQYDECPKLKTRWGCDDEHVAPWCPATCKCANYIV
ncbi:serotriflin-like isoform X1 [Sardina pilchardus]|uniref:serotriflin-like isoform X1 n=1 Tax=Sardina pilchardus TaxID=27697 RepID=UPI002E0D5FAD